MTTIKESEWLGIAATIRAYWPHAALPDSTLEAWFQGVKDLPRGQVEAAVEVFYRDGREYPPNGGQIRAKVFELRTDAPRWGEAWQAIRKAQMKAPALHVDPDERLPWLREQGHTVIADFMEAVGWPEADEWSDDNLESRLRRKWEDWLRDKEAGQVRQGINAHGLARLERGDGTRKLRIAEVASASVGKPIALPSGEAEQ